MWGGVEIQLHGAFFGPFHVEMPNVRWTWPFLRPLPSALRLPRILTRLEAPDFKANNLKKGRWLLYLFSMPIPDELTRDRCCNHWANSNRRSVLHRNHMYLSWLSVAHASQLLSSQIPKSRSDCGSRIVVIFIKLRIEFSYLIWRNRVLEFLNSLSNWKLRVRLLGIRNHFLWVAKNRSCIAPWSRATTQEK